jgi:hypothetical protein
MTNGTHNARTAGALTLRPGVTSQPGQQPAAAMPRGDCVPCPHPPSGPPSGAAIQTISPLGHTRAVHPT